MSLARTLLIVPAAHYRVLDAGFQAEMYELFHTRAGCRLLHMLSTPVAVVGLMLALGSALGPGWSWWPPLALGVIVVAWGLRVDRVVGAVMVPLAALSMVAAHRAGHATQHPVALGAALALGAATVQFASHAFEDIPPPMSDDVGWVPAGAWLRKASVGRMLTFLVLGVTMYTWLELWASPRVWSLQVLHLLMRAGHRPGLRAELSEKVSAIFTHPEREWRVPSP